jgi:nicotinamidase-related amidase
MTATPPPQATVVAASPYPWPFNGVDPSALACVVVGWDTAWAARTSSTVDIVGAIDTVARTVVAAGGHLVTVAHHDRSGPATAPGAVGLGPQPTLQPTPQPTLQPAPQPTLQPTPQRLHPPAALVGGDAIDAGGIDGFFDSPLDGVLRHRRAHQLVIVGHGLEGPVHSTLRSANDRGYECLLVIDACTPIDAALVPAARLTVEMSGGIFGAVTTTAELTRDLLPTAAAFTGAASSPPASTDGDPPGDQQPCQGATS